MPTLDLTTVQLQDASNTRLRRIGKYTGPASYVTGGDALTPANLALGQIHFAGFEVASNGTDLRLVLYDYTNQKVKWFDLAGSEIGNGTNLSAYSARFEIIGR